MDQASLQQAIHHAQRGNWQASHALVQDAHSAAAHWLHAILHRIEGDLANAAYWYRQAQQTMAEDDPLAELARLAAAYGIES